MKKYIIGIDGGGSYVRALLSDENMNIIAFEKIEGGASPVKNANPKENIEKAIFSVIKKSNVNIKDISIVVCGVADLNNKEDLEWATNLTDIKGLTCPKFHFNDAIIAARGAFDDGMGIIVIAGTGSIVLGLNDNREVIRNYDFGHKAYAGARYLSINTIYEIISGNISYSDNNLISSVLLYFNFSSIKDLSIFFLSEFKKEEAIFLKKLSEMAPLITKEAKNGSKIARMVCEEAMKNIALGTKMVGSTFDSESIKVNLVGSVIQDFYMTELYFKYLGDYRYILHKEVYSASEGAVLLGIEILNGNNLYI